jgi:hypothetical protein
LYNKGVKGFTGSSAVLSGAKKNALDPLPVHQAFPSYHLKIKYPKANQTAPFQDNGHGVPQG